jgi:uncharacterized membrane protein
MGLPQEAPSLSILHSCVPPMREKAYARRGSISSSPQEVSMRSALGVIVVIGAFAVMPAAAQKEQTWKGAISDSKCNGTHPAGEHDGKKMTDTDCTNVCMKKGAKYVFVSEGKVYQLANQKSKTIASHAGQQVELIGTLEGDTITAKTMKTPATK